MSDENSSPVFQIQRMYLKDLSLEQPNSPAILLQQAQPQVEINLSPRVSDLGVFVEKSDFKKIRLYHIFDSFFLFSDDGSKRMKSHGSSCKTISKRFENLAIQFIQSECVNTERGKYFLIKDIVIKTLISIQPDLLHSYRTCQPGDIYNNMCFEILGFDIMLDDKGRAYLIEVNHAPSFNVDTKLDEVVKHTLLVDTFKLLNCTIAEKNRILESLKQI